MKVAIYARYSSNNQRDASIADQLRICRIHAEKQGWQIAEEYTDHAISGVSLLRPGMQALMSDANRGRFHIVLAEAMDRLSRDQEDIAGLFKRMAYSDVKIITLSEGEVTHLHVGLKGTMNALFLKDLADKTRRGLRGRVELGKSGGGNSYGYDVVRRLLANGELDRGDRSINPQQADIVRRIFREYAAGKSGQRIAYKLNAEGILGPSGGAWGASTINGNPKRGTGILNNEMYIGRIIWNRLRFIKDPDTGRRQSRPNPEEEWVIQEFPDLRIVDGDPWKKVKDRQAKCAVGPQSGCSSPLPLWQRRRQRYLLSGLMKCGSCGGTYSVTSATGLGCSSAWNKGTCSNRRTMRRDHLEERVLAALRGHLMDPSLFAEFCAEFTRETNNIRRHAAAGRASAEAEIKKIDRDLEKMVDLILAGGTADKINAKMLAMEARMEVLQRELDDGDQPPPLLHPSMAHHYRAQLDNLAKTLDHADEAKRFEASEIIRSLIDEITLTPIGDSLEIEVRGDLAGILSIAHKQRKARSKAGLRSMDSEESQLQVSMVAGAGFEPATFRL